MTCKGIVNGNVVVLDPDVAIPDGAMVEVRALGPPSVVLSLPSSAARIEAARAWKAQLSSEELRSRVEATAGMLTGIPDRVEQFLREKHEETEWEEERWERRQRR